VLQRSLQLAVSLISCTATQVAVKQLNMTGADSAAENAFFKEAHTLQSASAMCHRVCRMLGCCKMDGDICLVMLLYPKSAAKLLEEAKGQSSSALLVFTHLLRCSCLATRPAVAAGPLDLQVVTAIAIEMLEALGQLHAVSVLHLDLKPGNLLLDEYRHVYLADFGISHAMRTLEACTAVTSASGTPHYM